MLDTACTCRACVHQRVADDLLHGPLARVAQRVPHVLLWSARPERLVAQRGMFAQQWGRA